MIDSKLNKRIQLILNIQAVIPNQPSHGVTWVLVVSNIDLTTNLPTMEPETFLQSTIKDAVINISHDYRYMKIGYYVSMHAEILGDTVIPSSKSIIEANRTPILLLKASKAGIPILPYLVTSSVKQIMSELTFPLVSFAVNPFSYDGYRIATNRSSLYRAVKSLSMNYKFAVCAQPLKGEMVSVKSIFGKCEAPEAVKRVSEKVYEVFKIPLCKLHVQNVGSEILLCGLQPLKKEEVLPEDLRTISEKISELSKTGGMPIG